nr:putative reverse transcriptase domain-containing protein [Tanacetum cinerariifolium]
KNQKYKWGVEQEKAFQTLKDNLCNAPILSLPDGAIDFVVYCDASNQAQIEAFKEENTTVEMLRDLDQLMEKKEDGGADKTYYNLRDMYGGHVCRRISLRIWDIHLPLVEFYDNNSYHSSIRCAPFEALCGRMCRSPVLWAEIRESKLIGPELVQETTDKVVLIKEKLKATGGR